MAEYTKGTPSVSVMAYSHYPFEMSWLNSSDYIDTVTSNSTATTTLRVNGITNRQLRLKMSPYAQTNIYGGTDDKFTTRTIENIVNHYATSAGIKVRKPYGDNYISHQAEVTGEHTDSAYRVRYEEPKWTLDENSWISSYTIDSSDNTLTVDLSTANYEINSTAPAYVNAYIPFENYAFQYIGDYGAVPAPNAGSMKRWKLRNNLIIKRGIRGDPFNHMKENEKVALETLREMVTEKEFRKYLRYGFVLVPGQSGSIYQIFRNKHHTKVWKGGKIIEEVCVRLRGGNVPSTDNVIAFTAMIRADEEEFKKIGNVYKMARAA